MADWADWLTVEYPRAPGKHNRLKFRWIEPETDEYKKYLEEIEKYYENMEECFEVSLKAREEEEEAKRNDETTTKIATMLDDEYYESSEEGKNSRRQPRFRFQLFWALISLDKYTDFKKFLLHGCIKASSSCEEEESDFDSVTLFCRDSNSDRPAFMKNNFPLDNLITQFSFPVNATTSSSLGINLNLYAKDCYNDDDFFQLCDDKKLELVKKYDTFCTQKIDLHDGSLYMGYIVLSNPVDVALDITFKTDHDVSEVPFIIKIHAYYGDNYGVDDGYQRGPSRYQRQCYRYKLRLFDGGGGVPLSDDYKFPLMTSSLAVPATSTLNICAKISAMFTGYIYLDTHICFIPPKRNGSTTGVIKGPRGCSLVVKVNWKYPLIASHQRSRE